MHYTLLVTMPLEGTPEYEAAEKWYSHLESWLEVVPGGVGVVVEKHETPTPQTHITAMEVIGLFRAWGRLPVRRLHYRARAAFYFVVEELYKTIDVRCSQCGLRYRIECRCPDKGHYTDGVWHYHCEWYPSSHTAQDWWVVNIGDLRALDPKSLDALVTAHTEVRIADLKVLLGLLGDGSAK